MTTLGEGESALDEAVLDAFADRMIGVLNDACTALMTSIGHQSGLFGTMATTGSATSAQVAEASGLNERYVREWLNAMAGGAEAEAWGLTNSRFELCDVATLDRPDAFDVITAFETIHARHIRRGY
jgi:hypothetical protein